MTKDQHATPERAATEQREVTWMWNLQSEGDTIRCTICEGDRPALIIAARDVRWMAQALEMEKRRA